MTNLKPESIVKLDNIVHRYTYYVYYDLNMATIEFNTSQIYDQIKVISKISG